MNRFAVFAAGIVGEMAVKLFSDNCADLRFIIIDDTDFWGWNEKICAEAEKQKVAVYTYAGDNQLIELCKDLDAVILAYWGKIIGTDLLDVPRWGFINLHTSFLPYGKGKHPHVWSIIEDTPYGATIMKIDAELDTGDVLFQKQCDVTWEDTGETLYFKSICAMDELLKEHGEEILDLKMKPNPQKEKGTSHLGRELDGKAHIDLDREYKARDILNILRAKTFEPFPGAYFEEDGKKYEIGISIKEVWSEEHVPYNYEEIWERNKSRWVL